jgi:cation transporter-like permease
MALIIWFLALVAAGDVLAYLVGLFVEYEWGGYTSLVVFLAMYFITLWVAWRIAVWMTTPKLVPDGTGTGTGAGVA